MSHCRWFLLQTLLLALCLAALLAAARQRVTRAEAQLLPARRQLVAALTLSDFALWSEARYARHPSQSDDFAPFQDFPSALDFFPAGSLVAPPPRHTATHIELRTATQKGP